MIKTAPGSVVFQNVSKTFGAFTAHSRPVAHHRARHAGHTARPVRLWQDDNSAHAGRAGASNGSRILIGGKDVTMLPANERDVSMVFQSYALFPHMTSCKTWPMAWNHPASRTAKHANALRKL